MLSPRLYKRIWESGSITSPIWLVFNPKHPLVSNYIWLPVLTEMQDKIFAELHTRIDTTHIYKRNVVSDSADIPITENWWGSQINTEIEEFRALALEHKPKIIISFGAFPYEFLRRAFRVGPKKGPKAWTNSKLEDEFGKSIQDFDINKTNLIPLLRRMSLSGKYKEEHNRDYFEKNIHNVSRKMAEKIIENRNHLKIWI